MTFCNIVAVKCDFNVVKIYNRIQPKNKLDVIGMGKDLNIVLQSMKIANRLIQHVK
jgi:hypothetical protein